MEPKSLLQTRTAARRGTSTPASICAHKYPSPPLANFPIPFLLRPRTNPLLLGSERGEGRDREREERGTGELGRRLRGACTPALPFPSSLTTPRSPLTNSFPLSYLLPRSGIPPPFFFGLSPPFLLGSFSDLSLAPVRPFFPAPEIPSRPPPPAVSKLQEEARFQLKFELNLPAELESIQEQPARQQVSFVSPDPRASIRSNPT